VGWRHFLLQYSLYLRLRSKPTVWDGDLQTSVGLQSHLKLRAMESSKPTVWDGDDAIFNKLQAEF
jgi:hypothetical protein